MEPKASQGKHLWSIRRRWLTSILVLVLVGGIMESALSRWVTRYGATVAVTHWYTTAQHHLIRGFYGRLDGHLQARLDVLTRIQGVADAVGAGDVAVLERLLGPTRTFWIAVDASGTRAVASDAPCRTDASGLLARLPLNDGLTPIACGDRWFVVKMAWANRGRARLLLGERVDSDFVTDLSAVLGTEVDVFDREGRHVQSSGQSTSSEPLTVALDAELSAAIASGKPQPAAPFRLSMAPYAGFGISEPRTSRGLTDIDVFASWFPFGGDDDSPLVVVMWVPVDFMMIGAQYSTLAMVGGTAIICLILAVLGWRLARRLARPLAELASAAGRVAEGDLRHRVAATGDAETAQLADAFNQMVSALEREQARVVERTAQLDGANRELSEALEQVQTAQGRLLQAGKMAAVGTLVAGLSHELNNPVAIISGYTQSLLRSLPDDAVERGPLQAIERQSARCAKLVRSLLDFSRGRSSSREPTSLGGAIERIGELATAHARRRDVALEVAVEADLPAIWGCSQELESAFLNLVTNALDATSPGGRVSLRASRSSRAEGGVDVAVSDTGTGIAPEALPHIFDPFFTTKAPGSGTGLGLALTHQIVTSHGGSIDVETQVGAGSTFTLWLPAGTPAGAREAA